MREANASGADGARPGQVDAVVVDLDGTLADTFGLLLAAFDAATRGARGRELTRAEMVAHFGAGAGTEEFIVAALAGREGMADLDLFYEIYSGRHGALVRLFPGLREALDEARRRGCALGLLTGKGRRTTDITLRELGVADRFDAIVTGDEAPTPKPDPRGLLAVLDRLGVPAARAIYVGDSPADIGAARAAGTLAAAALWHDPEDTRLHELEPDFVLRSGDELRALVIELTGGTVLVTRRAGTGGAPRRSAPGRAPTRRRVRRAARRRRGPGGGAASRRADR